MRLINADILQTSLVEEYNRISGFETRQQFYRAIEITKRQPTIKPVKRGEWMQETQFVPAINLDVLEDALVQFMELGCRIIAVVPGSASNFNVGYLVIYESAGIRAEANNEN